MRPSVLVSLALSFVILPAAASDLAVDGKLVSTTTSGPPLQVASTELVTNLAADSVDGVGAADLARRLGNVVRVGKFTGDFTSLDDAVDSISGATAANPYLVHLGPGVFGGPSVTLPGHVHLVGSGREATIFDDAISVHGPTTVRALTISKNLSAVAVFMAADSSLALSDASVEGRILAYTGELDVASSSIDARRSAVVLNGTDATFDRVEVLASAPNDPGAGATAIENNNGSVTIVGSYLTVRGVAQTTLHNLYGVYASPGADGTRLLDSTIDADPGPYSSVRGLWIEGGDLLLDRATLVAPPVGSNPAYGIFLDDSGGAASVAHSTIRSRTCLRTEGTDLVVQHARLFCTGNTTSVQTTDAATTRIVHTHVDGALMREFSGGTNVCRFTTDEDFDTYTSTCP